MCSVDVTSIRKLNIYGLFSRLRLLVLMASVKKGSHGGCSSKLPGPRSMAWGVMRFAPRRSERSVAVATAKSSLTNNRRGVRLDTSLGFLMKLASALVHA